MSPPVMKALKGDREFQSFFPLNSHMPFSKKYFLLFFVIFLLSVIVRIPTLNRPLSKHHEFCTAVALRILQIWDKAGISTYRFNPVMTYPNPTDKFINNHASGSGEMMDITGTYYYTSHPPLAYYIPFFVFNISGRKADVLSLQLFNVLIHLLCGIGVYLILLQLSPLDSSISICAIAGYVAYMFSPGTLWFHSNVYMADMLVQLFFVYGVYVALRIFSERRKKWIATLSVIVFLMMYTSWLGILFGFTIIAVEFILLFRSESDKSLSIQVILAVLLGLASALLLTFLQYSQIAGWSALKHEWTARFIERSGWNTLIFFNVKAIVFNYLTSYLLLFISILFIKRFRSIMNKKLFWYFIAVSTIPIMLLHILLSNYSGHDFTSLYGGLFISVLFGLFVKSVAERLNYKLIIGLIVFISMNVLLYYYINRPGEFSIRGDRYADMQDIGKTIAANCSDDEVIFLNGMKPSPEVVFYAGRNILQVQNDLEARNFLIRYTKNKGVIFRVGDGNKFSGLSRINLNESD